MRIRCTGKEIIEQAVGQWHQLLAAVFCAGVQGCPHGLSVLSPDPPRHSREPGTREYRSMDKGQSWKMDLIPAIEDTMALARSQEHFIKLLERRGYKVRWTGERKSITYTTPSGMKCRDNKLHEDKFLKEAMEYEFKLRAEIIERIEGSGPAAGAGGTGSRALRDRDREELRRDDWSTAVADSNVDGDSVGGGSTGYQERIDSVL